MTDSSTLAIPSITSPSPGIKSPASQTQISPARRPELATFSTLPPGVGEDIAEATANVIRPGGAFLVYQFSPKVLDFIRPHFAPIKRGFEWINVPPATLFWAWRETREG